MKNVYTLSASGRILSVGPEWDANATQADTPELMSEHVIGRSLWDFVSGIETQAYLNAILFACRMDHQPFSMICRCDMPGMAQDFRFSVEPQADETLVLSTSELVTRGHAISFADDDDSIDTLRCSICCSFKLGDHWIDPMTQPDMRYFASGFGICPTCRDMTVGQLKERMAERQGKLVPFRKPNRNGN